MNSHLKKSTEAAPLQVDLDAIGVLPGFNPRSDVGDIVELKESLRTRGLINPLAVCPQPGSLGQYYLLAGARRLAALRSLGFTHALCTVHNVDAKSAEALAVALAENSDGARQSLPPLDLAKAYIRLGEMLPTKGLSQKAKHMAIGAMVGRSDQHVRTTMRLLEAPDVIREKLAKGEMSKGAVNTIMEVPEEVRQRVTDRLMTMPATKRTEGEVRRLANDIIREDAVAAPVDIEAEGAAEKPATKATPSAAARSRAGALGAVVWRNKREVAAEIDAIIGSIMRCRREKDVHAEECSDYALGALLWATGATNDTTPGTSDYKRVFKALAAERKEREAANTEERGEKDE